MSEPKLTPTQAEALADLRKLEPNMWRGYGSGNGKFNVALRGLKHRHPNFLELKIDENGKELWRLAP